MNRKEVKASAQVELESFDFRDTTIQISLNWLLLPSPTPRALRPPSHCWLLLPFGGDRAGKMRMRMRKWVAKRAFLKINLNPLRTRWLTSCWWMATKFDSQQSLPIPPDPFHPLPLDGRGYTNMLKYPWHGNNFIHKINIWLTLYRGPSFLLLVSSRLGLFSQFANPTHHTTFPFAARQSSLCVLRL